jgi:hypothetical protein
MKKYILTIAIISFIGNYAIAQINLPIVPNVSITGEHAFIDASDYGLNWSNNEAKGLNFPQTDLTQWVFKTDFLNGMQFSTAYDGMVVYNTGTGSTLTTDPFGGLEILQKANNGVVTTVTPGFYYFYNPLQPMTSSTDIVEFGKWIPLGTGGSGVVTVPVKSYNNLTETSTGISIDGKIVYAITGEFTTLGVNALITIAKPLGMTGYYKMTTYQNGRTFRSEISSFDIDPLVLTNNVVTGSGLFSEVYPLGTYTYTLEYFKS